MKTLARRGPHKVDRGDLGIVGLAGQVFAPVAGRDLPGIAFGHAWVRNSKAYRDLFVHLASWGIVVAAPDTEGGPIASDVELATDLRAALTVLSSVQLGTAGQITVNADRLGLAGHGFGAAAAVRAASSTTLLGRPPVPVRALTALFPAPTTADLPAAAATVSVPALIVAGSEELDSMTANAVVLAKALGGDVVLRTLPGADGRSLLERTTIKSFIGINGADSAVHKAVRAQLTGYLLYQLSGDEKYAAFADPEEATGVAAAVDVATATRADNNAVAQLLGAPAYSPDR